MAVEKVFIPQNQHTVSRTVPAISLVESSPIWGGAGWSVTKVTLASTVGAYKIHIYPFGLLDPWGNDAAGPTTPTPELWATGNRLITALNKIREIDADAPIILTLYGASWWMKGSLHTSNGSTTLLTKTDEFSDQGRVMLNYLDEYLVMVDEAIRIAAAEPYNCRDFEDWNEAKGYYSVPAGTGQTWDASMSPGTSNNANMGYSYKYQQTSIQIVATMTSLGIARDQYRISGPYPVLGTKGSSAGSDPIASNHPLYQYGPKWGYADKAPINFTRTFLGHARDNDFEFDVLSLDTSTFIRDSVYPTSNPFDLSSKFTPITNYWRSSLAEYGFDSDMPIDYAEIYAFPLPALQTSGQQALRTALWADALTQCIFTRVRYPIIWGATGLAQGTNFTESGLILSAATGTKTVVGEMVGYVRDHFGPGAKVKRFRTESEKVDGMVSGTKGLLYNKTNEELTVEINYIKYPVEPYETKLFTIPNVRWPFARR